MTGRASGLLVRLVAMVATLGLAEAHIPERILIELETKEDSWVAKSEMDVKFAVVALMRHYIPPDTGSGWIDNLNPGQIGLVKEVTEKLYRERFQLALGGERLEMAVDFPDYEIAPVRYRIGENDEPVVRVVMRGSYPAGASGSLTASWEAKWGPALVLTRQGLNSTAPAPAPVVRVELGETVELKGWFGAGASESAGSGRRAVTLLQWVGLGFEHLVPKGPQHILFLLGLLLLVPKRNPILAQAACFTVAHSLSFWLVMLGVFEVPSWIVTIVLALGLVYIGIENLFLKAATPWRLGVVSGLGLVHGVAFAGVMQTLPVPGQGEMAPLAGFHLGVELAQIAVLAAALLLAWPFLKRSIFPRLRTLGSIAIATVGLIWTVELLVV